MSKISYNKTHGIFDNLRNFNKQNEKSNDKNPIKIQINSKIFDSPLNSFDKQWVIQIPNPTKNIEKNQNKVTKHKILAPIPV